MTWTPQRLLGALFALSLIVAACGSDDSATTSADATTSTATSSSSTTASTAALAMTDSTTSTTAATTDSPVADDDLEEPGDDDADIVIDVVMAGDSVEVSGGDRIEIPVGSVVKLSLTTDVTAELHVHGYDFTLEVTAGQSEWTAFPADIAGRFEVEIESTGAFVTELVVS